jgi:hypothetical protein
MILPHPLPSPHGEGELLADGLIRRTITSVQGCDARLFRGNLTHALLLGEGNFRPIV